MKLKNLCDVIGDTEFVEVLDHKGNKTLYAGELFVIKLYLLMKYGDCRVLEVGAGCGYDDEAYVYICIKEKDDDTK